MAGTVTLGAPTGAGQIVSLLGLDYSEVLNFALVSKSLNRNFNGIKERNARAIIEATHLKMSNGKCVSKITAIAPSASTASSSFEKSATAVQSLILSGLQRGDLSRLCLVSRSINSAVNNDQVWKTLFSQVYPGQNLPLSIPFKFQFFLFLKGQKFVDNDELVFSLQKPSLSTVSMFFGRVMIGFKDGCYEVWEKNKDKLEILKKDSIPLFPKDARNFHFQDGLVYVMTQKEVHKLDFVPSKTERETQLEIIRQEEARQANEGSSSLSTNSTPANSADHESKSDEDDDMPPLE